MQYLHIRTVFLVMVLLTIDCYHANENDEPVGMKAVESIFKDLEYIEKAEDAQGTTADADGDSDILKARLETCDGLMYEDPSKQTGYVDFVKESLVLWNDCLQAWYQSLATATWNFETDINNDTEKTLNDVTVQVASSIHNLANLARAYQSDSRYEQLSPIDQRQLHFFGMDDTPKSNDNQESLSTLETDLQDIYSKARVDSLPLEPNIIKIMATSRNAKELEYYWTEWRRVSGALMKDKYEEFVRLLNIGATDNDYHDYGQSWLERQFDKDVDIKTVSEKLWQEVKPLYQQLHAYVRNKLRAEYPDYESIYRGGGIPAHLTGNMWAQQWNNIYDLVKPFKEISEPNYDKALREQNYTVQQMFDLAESFYKSIGLYEMTDKFNELSMKERPADREVVCHASASDFYREDDFRIKMCTEVNTEYMSVIHHEMGHIEYFMAYADQPTVFRDGANSGFHEAIGDTISMSVMTPKHMKAIGLVDEGSVDTVTKSSDGYTEDEKRQINFLLKIALSKIAFLPFGYLIDKWRWDVFDGTVTEERYNRHWWELRKQYQGIIPPVERSENDFDPGAKFHIASNSPYICYFISHILQFQFYEAMCNESGQLNDNSPLHNCDFYESSQAGDLLKNMLSLGKSKPWNESLFEMTGSYDISSASIMKYFKPLHDWLKKENDGTPIGWDNADIPWSSQSQSTSKYHPRFGSKHQNVDRNVWNTITRPFRKTHASRKRTQSTRAGVNSYVNTEEFLTLLHEILEQKK